MILQALCTKPEHHGASGEARLRPVELAHDVRRGAVVGHRVVERLRVVPDDDVARVPGVEVRERGARRVREDHAEQVPARLLRFQSLDDHVRAADVEHRAAVERVRPVWKSNFTAMASCYIFSG